MSPTAAAALLRINAVIGMILFGIAWALFAFGIDEPAGLVLDVLKWPLDGDPGGFDADHRWFGALGGGFLAGFGVLFATLVASGVARGDPAARRAGLLSIATWFVIDSAGSIAAGAAPNAAWNVLVLALFAGPILLARRAP